MTYDEEGHVVISPRELQEQAFEDPHGLSNHALMPGTPRGFPTYQKYTHFVDYLSDKLGIHPHHFLFRGSTKVGFSISPNREKRKTWQQFGPTSDLDLAIVDPHFYSVVDEEVRRFDRTPQNLEKIFQSRNSTSYKQYTNRINQKGRHDCYRYFDLPQELSCLAEINETLNNAPIEKHCVYHFPDLRAFIFRDRWAVQRRYLTDLADLCRGLKAGENPLPAAPESPFSAELLE